MSDNWGISFGFFEGINTFFDKTFYDSQIKLYYFDG